MEAKTPDTVFVELERYPKALAYRRTMPVEGSIKTGHLRQLWVALGC